jgi:exopolyphosphatase/pppGpp-phosphohydrolase
MAWWEEQAPINLASTGFEGGRSERHHLILSKEAIQNQLALYRSKTLEGRKTIPGLPSDRTDVILAGATILYLAMEELGCPSAMISTHGVRYGLLYQKLKLQEEPFSG